MRFSVSLGRGPGRGSAFGEHVFVLRVADDQPALAVLVGDDELEAAEGGHDGDEGDGAVVVLARGDRARPLAEVERDRRAGALHLDAAEILVRIARGELADVFGCRRDHEALALPRKRGPSALRARRGYLLRPGVRV